jgi:hypothetical protein
MTDLTHERPVRIAQPAQVSNLFFQSQFPSLGTAGGQRGLRKIPIAPGPDIGMAALGVKTPWPREVEIQDDLR